MTREQWKARRAAEKELLEAVKDAVGGLAKAYKLMNAYASGDTQNLWVRVDANGVLGQVYGDLAPGYLRLNKALEAVEALE